MTKSLPTNLPPSRKLEDTTRAPLGSITITGAFGLFTAFVLLLQVSDVRADATATLDWNAVSQRIDGFGASSAWIASWTPSQADMFFSTNSGTGTSLNAKTHFSFTGIGLSLLRNHITFATSTAPTATPTTGELTLMQMAQTRGAKVWSAPWTPASGFKSNNGPNGGNYLGSGNNSVNLAYAKQLVNYVARMRSYGVKLYAISVQNEPDANVTSYEACVWTGNQIHDFVTNLYSALAANGQGATKIIVPESEIWSGNPGLYTPTLSDPNSAADVSIVANHDYVGDNVTGDTATPAPLPASGLATWETEVSQIGGSYDGSITNAIYWAGRIHLYMTAAHVNAWHYWWLISQGPDNEGLTDTNGIPAKRMYALGQFSRFVRPNYYLINTVKNTGGAEISAYKDSTSPSFAIVAINPTSTPIQQTFNITNAGVIASVTPWMTTSNLSIASQLPVSVSNSSFASTLPPLSITTFAGLANPPVLAIAPVGGNLTVSWPSTSLPYTLLQSPTLSPANWTTNTTSIQTTNGTNSITLTPPPGDLFLRLRSP